MQYIMVATRDIKANVFAMPQYITNRGHFLRAFADEVNRATADNLLHNHAEDFELYELGEFNDETGQCTMLPQPKQLAVASNLLVDKK